jgi:hypothetical protein
VKKEKNPGSLDDAMPHELTPENDPGTYDLLEPNVARKEKSDPAWRGPRLEHFFYLLAVLAFLAHGQLILRAMGGVSGLTSPEPILRDDHPLYFHSAIVTRSFLKNSLSTAGYDHRFMGGYAKSAVFPASSNLPELTLAATENFMSPATAYKIYVLLSAVLAPMLIWFAAHGLTGSGLSGSLSMVAYLLYIWTDFPSQYIGFGMLPYFLSIPLALVTLYLCTRWLGQGGFKLWLGMTLALAITTLVHFTALMVLAPAAIAAWAFAEERPRKAMAAIASVAITLFANAFWWWPGVLLAATKGESGFAFSHPEGVLERLGKIVWSEAPIEPLLILGLLAGGPLFWKRDKITTVGLIGFAAGGFFWGYLAGAFRGLDFLQPGRHTYAFYIAAAVFSGYWLVFLLEWLRRTNRQSAIGLVAGLVVVCTRLYGPILYAVGSQWAAAASPALTSAPPPAYQSIKQAIKTQVAPGSRIFYEEGGFGGDPFAGGRYSGVLADELDIEMIGGPYLHASLTTNQAQFGEGKLLGKDGWDAAWLEEVAERYGVSWVFCWSDRARVIVDSNRDRFQVVYQDGPFRLAKINRTAALQPGLPLVGQDLVDGPVQVANGRLRMTLKPVDSGTAVDRIVVLRYHWVPNLRVTGAEGVRVEPESLPDNRFPPLVKLLLKPSAKGLITLELDTWGRGE